MKTLQVKDLPEAIYFRLVRMAEAEGRSLTQQAITILSKGLDLVSNSKEKRKKLLSDLKTKIDPNTTKGLPKSIDLIREDRER